MSDGLMISIDNGGNAEVVNADDYTMVAIADIDAANRRFDTLKAENAKLREFVRAVAEDVYERSLFDCGGCRFFDGCYNGGEMEHKGRDCQWYTWSRELGIEVSE